MTDNRANRLNLLIDDAIVSADALFSPLGKPILCAGKQMVEQAINADALIIRSRTQVDESLLTDCPNLRFIGSSVVGLDHVDQDACARHDVTFYSAQGCNARSVAEYVITNLVKFISEQGKQFEEITLGVVGVGQVGKRVAKMAQALGIRCLLNDPPRADTEIAFVQTELSQLLMQSDIVTFHTPLTRSGDYPSFHLLYIDNIHLVKPNALIINAARGGVIDESAMLVREDLSFIIDCWENEPYCNSELLKRSICATPHIAGHAIDAKYRGGQMVAQALADWLGVEYYAPSLVVDVSTLSDLNISDVGLSNIQQLAYVLMQFYDFSQDDHVLRSALSAELRDDFAKIFELYRREYPFRYEWHHFSIPDGLDTQIVSWLNALMD